VLRPLQAELDEPVAIVIFDPIVASPVSGEPLPFGRSGLEGHGTHGKSAAGAADGREAKRDRDAGHHADDGRKDRTFRAATVSAGIARRPGCRNGFPTFPAATRET